MELHERVREFTRQTLAAMGLTLDVTINDTPDGIRVEISGEGGEGLLRRPHQRSPRGCRRVCR